MENTEKTPQQRLDDFINDNKISIQTNFVPFSFSRDSDKVNIEEDKDKLYRSNGLSINWNVKILGNKKTATIEYSQGIGHLKYEWLSYGFSLKKADDAKFANILIFDAVENGLIHKYATTIEQFQNTKLIKNGTNLIGPNLKDILDCMILDSSVLEHPVFESWANEMGYNPDSREGEKIYNKCKEISTKFLEIVGGQKKLQELSEILSDLDNEPAPQTPTRTKAKL